MLPVGCYHLTNKYKKWGEKGKSRHYINSRLSKLAKIVAKLAKFAILAITKPPNKIAGLRYVCCFED